MPYGRWVTLCSNSGCRTRSPTPPPFMPSRCRWTLFLSCASMWRVAFSDHLGGIGLGGPSASCPTSSGSDISCPCARSKGRLRGESYRAIAEVLLGFYGTKEDFEAHPAKNKARRLVAHGIKMMRGVTGCCCIIPSNPTPDDSWSGVRRADYLANSTPTATTTCDTKTCAVARSMALIGRCGWLRCYRLSVSRASKAAFAASMSEM